MTEYILMSTDDKKSVADGIGVRFIGKEDAEEFTKIGTRYRDSRLIVVDDAPIMGVKLMNYMEQAARDAGTPNPDFEYFQDPRKALESFRQIRPDVVISDFHMPWMNGYELISRMVEIEKKPVSGF